MQADDSSNTDLVARSVDAHAVADAAEIARLRSLTQRERAQMLEAACAAAAEIERSRLAAGMPRTEPAPWPASTWELLRKHARDVRG
jgi:hypothetical protein